MFTITYLPETYEALIEGPVECIKQHSAACHEHPSLSSTSLKEDQLVLKLRILVAEDEPAKI